MSLWDPLKDIEERLQQVDIKKTRREKIEENFESIKCNIGEIEKNSEEDICTNCGIPCILHEIDLSYICPSCGGIQVSYSSCYEEEDEFTQSYVPPIQTVNSISRKCIFKFMEKDVNKQINDTYTNLQSKFYSHENKKGHQIPDYVLKETSQIFGLFQEHNIIHRADKRFVILGNIIYNICLRDEIPCSPKELDKALQLKKSTILKGEKYCREYASKLGINLEEKIYKNNPEKSKIKDALRSLFDKYEKRMVDVEDEVYELYQKIIRFQSWHSSLNSARQDTIVRLSIVLILAGNAFNVPEQYQRYSLFNEKDFTKVWKVHENTLKKYCKILINHSKDIFE